MAKGRINKTNVDRLACPADKSMEVLWDDALRGFGVIALPSGHKTFVVQCKRNGRSQKAKIRLFGPMTAEQARTQALNLQGAINLALTQSLSVALRVWSALLAKSPRTSWRSTCLPSGSNELPSHIDACSINMFCRNSGRRKLSISAVWTSRGCTQSLLTHRVRPMRRCLSFPPYGAGLHAARK